MRKALILAVAALLVTVVTVAAQSVQKPTPQAPQAPTAAKVGPNFVDANGDGICDHFQDGTCQCAGRMGMAHRRGVAANSTGVPAVNGQNANAPGRGPGNGICDGTGPKGPRWGRGPRR